MSQVRVPTEQFFLEKEKRVVQVSHIALFIYIGLRVFMHTNEPVYLNKNKAIQQK